MTRTPSRQDHIRPSFFEKYRLPLITLLLSTLYFTTVYAAGWMTGIYAPTGGWGVWNPSKSQTDPPDITITTTGSVGIGGITSPSAKLHVAGNAIANTPIAPSHLTTKDYVDAAVSAGGANYGGWGGGTGGIILQEFVYDTTPPQYGCPSGWVYVGRVNVYPATLNSVCSKGAELYQYFTDKDGDGLLDINSIAYGQAYNYTWLPVSLKGFDLNPDYPDASAQKSGTIIYRALGFTGSNFSRSYMDTFCQSRIPSGKLLTNIHAFISTSPTDRIKDMPNNYGYNPYRPIWMLGNSGSLLHDTYPLASNWNVINSGPKSIIRRPDFPPPPPAGWRDYILTNTDSNENYSSPSLSPPWKHVVWMGIIQPAGDASALSTSTYRDYYSSTYMSGLVDVFQDGTITIPITVLCVAEVQN